MELESIYTIIISWAPAITSIIGIIVAIVSGIKKLKSIDGTLGSVQTQTNLITQENKMLKQELQKVYKMHSEIVNKVYYQHPTNCDCEECNNGLKKN